jgi:hypothetical protein
VTRSIHGVFEHIVRFVDIGRPLGRRVLLKGGRCYISIWMAYRHQLLVALLQHREVNAERSIEVK